MKRLTYFITLIAILGTLSCCRDDAFVPVAPDYSDGAMWHNVLNDQGEGVDVFYVVSTWEFDWFTADSIVSHHADVFNPRHRAHMDIEMKKVCFSEIERCCPNIKLIGSCSSSILPDALAAAADKYADRIIVTHPFFPVHMVPYFEICYSEKTADGVVDYAKQVLAELDRKPSVLKKPNPGFIGNYLQFALWAACLNLVEQGICDPKDVDNCLNYSFCPRYSSIGIFDHFDNGGYKLNITTCNAVFPILPRWDAAPDCIREKAESPDAWGAKSPTKLGFYDWNGVDMVEYQKKVNAPYWKFINWEFPAEKMDK